MNMPFDLRNLMEPLFTVWRRIQQWNTSQCVGQTSQNEISNDITIIGGKKHDEYPNLRVNFLS